jgi:hypothetical protein
MIGKSLDGSFSQSQKLSLINSKKELMQYLGLVGYYRKFCPNCSTITCSVITLLRKDAKFTWAESCQLAFDKNMAKLPILHLFSIWRNNPNVFWVNFDSSFLLQQAFDIIVNNRHFFWIEKRRTSLPPVKRS